jgi:hypothetical protein
MKMNCKIVGRIASVQYILNRMLRGIFGPNSEKVARDWRRLHNEELNIMYASLNIIRVIKSREIKLTGHVTRT